LIKKETSRSVKRKKQNRIDQDRGGARAEKVLENSSIVGALKSVQNIPKLSIEGDHCDSN
jgi:hypothetical protein